MRITRGMVGEIARSFLDVLDAWVIEDDSDLERCVGRSFRVSGEDSSRVDLTLNPSGSGTSTHTVSYVTPEELIPLEVKVNKVFGYVNVILKAQEVLRERGYTCFAYDTFNNMTQSKVLRGAGFKEARKELEDLAKLFGR